MQGKLFIGNLSFKTTSESLAQAFSSYGEIVECKVIEDRETRRSRGFGFVTFANQKSAEKALEMNGQSVDERPLRVNFAEEKRDDRDRRG